MGKPHILETDLDIPEVEQTLPSDFPVPPVTTGTVDDDDDPADERTDENEAPVHERNENTEAADEFQYNDEEPMTLMNEKSGARLNSPGLR